MKFRLWIHTWQLAIQNRDHHVTAIFQVYLCNMRCNSPYPRSRCVSRCLANGHRNYISTTHWEGLYNFTIVNISILSGRRSWSCFWEVGCELVNYFFTCTDTVWTDGGCKWTEAVRQWLGQESHLWGWCKFRFSDSERSRQWCLPADGSAILCRITVGYALLHVVRQ